MAFVDREVSTQDGKAIALYTFRWDKTFWRYTSADRDIERMEVVPGMGNDPIAVTYTAIAIQDDGMVQGGSSVNDFTVTAQSDIPLTTLFRSTPPAETIWLTVRRMHQGEVDAPIYWIGWITNLKRPPDDASVQIACRPITASFKRIGLRLGWSRTCPHILYDQNCKVNKDDFLTVATVSAKTGVSIEVNNDGGKPDGYFAGGFISWEANADGTIERRTIEAHTGNVLSIFGTTDRLDVGTEINMYPGCDLTAETCELKFDNLDNGGMHEYMPGKSPFQGSQVF